VSEKRHREPLPLGGEDGLPFSKGLLARAVIASGVPAEKAYELALTAEADLAAAGSRASSLERLQELAVGMWGEEEGAQVIRRLRLFGRLDDLDLPVVLLIGGATGTGKSTVATEIAYRLGITRVTSTDFVRQTMRAFFSKDFMPAIHYSSFEAGTSQDEDDEDHRYEHLATGEAGLTRTKKGGTDARDRIWKRHDPRPVVAGGKADVDGVLGGATEIESTGALRPASRRCSRLTTVRRSGSGSRKCSR